MEHLQLRGIGMTSPRARRKLIEQLRASGIRDDAVLDVMEALPRHLFLDEALYSHAYENKSLPIGNDQTISQPWVVARMTELLRRGGPLRRVLEIGTGSGYQTAVLSGLCDELYTVERIESLQLRARRVLRKLQCRNVRYQVADGSLGWPQRGPYDGIIVTAAPETIPESLRAQLAPGGRLVLPAGPTQRQRLNLLTRTPSGDELELLDAVQFVPLISD